MKSLLKLTKRGFTIVELVIVIAVIAVLAAVTIPTFSNIIKKAQISADVQLCRNLNTVLANAAAEGRIPSSVFDVLYLENEAGYILENLNPTADGMYFAWDQENNKIVYLMADLVNVYYPEEYTLNPSKCWITVGSAEEAKVIAEKGYNLALEKDIEEEIVLNNVVSINTLGYTATKIVFEGVDSKANETAYMVGSFGEISGNIAGASIVQQGNASTVSVSGSSGASVTISGSVTTYSSSVVNSTVSSQGTITNLSSGSTVTNNGIIKTAESGSSVVNNGTINANNGASVSGSTQNVSVTFKASSKEDLENLRNQVFDGKETFEGRKVELSGDINLNNIAFTPISSYYRKGSDGNMTTAYAEGSFFQGEFDGKGYTINGLTNDGFSLAGLTASTNATSTSFGNIVYNESIYGLFASTYNAKISNVYLNGVNIQMMKSDADQMVGDSVGALVGFSYGNLTLTNITVSGTIKGYDGVGGIVGRAYGTGTVKMDNVVNNANVVGARHTGGMIGYVSGPKIEFKDCQNNGNIECLGWKYDKNVLGCSKVTEKNASGYYVVGAAHSGGSLNTTGIAGFTHNKDARIILAGKDCNYITMNGDANWTDAPGY